VPNDPDPEADDIRTQVQALARLASLAVAPSDVDAVGRDLASVLSLIETLNAAPTEGIEPMAHPLSAELRLRDDEVVEGPSREALQAPAPEVQEGYFLVPRVIE